MVCVFDEASAVRFVRALEEGSEEAPDLFGGKSSQAEVEASLPEIATDAKERWLDRALRDACARARTAGVREVAALI